MCRFANALPLKQFMHRRRVLVQFRAFLRTARALQAVDPASGAMIREQVSTGYRQWALEPDKQHCLALIADADRQLTTLRGMLEAAQLKHGAGAASSAAEAAGSAGEGAGQSAGASGFGRPAQAATPSEPSGWFGQGPEDDVHGRVGSGWPWQRGG